MKLEGFSQFRNLDPEDFYKSEEGYIVYTEKYHLKRGYCCKNGCKHCPYGFNKSKKAIKKNKGQ
ncbi:MAG: DUF5522 domain-containing protein [Flavobacteriales bacterium]|jgi:hypothetical protein|tara:strand:- start:1034 stop:1225 length:192 start_codon:yes stop_codon:yes gene_type:complete